MAFFTGSANSPTDLKSLIETKAVLAGWTLTGDWLSKGISNVQITAPDAKFLKITGANSSDGLTTPAPDFRCLWVDTLYWPVTYYLFVNTNPDVIVLAVKYSTNKVQMMMFGNLKKVADAAYIGGNFFWASGGPSAGSVIAFSPSVSIDDSRLQVFTMDNLITGADYTYNHQPTCIPFTNCSPANLYINGLHAEIDTDIWGLDGQVTYTDTTLSSLFRSPNTWDSQTHLVPMNLQYAMADGYYAYLGYIEHIRLVRVDNYEVGDIITISPDQWMVFPWRIKDTTHRNTKGTGATTGTLGFAVRYTP